MTQVNNSYCTLYVVRHGQTDWNEKEITQGHVDIPLNSEGIKQAQTIKGYETDEEVSGMMRVLLNHLSEETYLSGAVSNSAYIKLESDGVDFFIKEMKGVKNPDV